MFPQLVSLLGMAIMIFLAWLCSQNRKMFPWRTVFWGLGLQLLFAVFILKTPVGASTFGLAQRAVLKLNDVALEGAGLVFGPLANEGLLKEKFGSGQRADLRHFDLRHHHRCFFTFLVALSLGHSAAGGSRGRLGDAPGHAHQWQ